MKSIRIVKKKKELIREITLNKISDNKVENHTEYKVKVQVNGTDLKEGNNLFNVKVEPILQAYYLEPIEPYEKKYTLNEYVFHILSYIATLIKRRDIPPAPYF